MALREDSIFHGSEWLMLLTAAMTYVSLRYLQAPYGKHIKAGWGPTIPSPLAWFLMESPTLWLTLLIFPAGRNSTNPKALILMAPFLLHYLNRTVLYPIRIHLNAGGKNSEFPVSVAAIAFVFNIVNGYLQARWVSHYKTDFEGLFWWKFGLGLMVFGVGLRINVWADAVLVGLKKQERGYQIPRGGLYDLICCPNYLGEMIEWLGWALMTWSFAGFVFFLNTCANLVPRARATRIWYLENFKTQFPSNRMAVVPFFY